jgi:SAM-dependent methyltransferase
MVARGAALWADHLLPHLRAGMRVLDCGCGPGSITLGLAAAVAPGEVIGLDIEPVQIERAHALAAAERMENLRFQTGDVYALPFPDAAFDVVNANSLLSHLSVPVRALREFRRVLRPGGIVAVRDSDWSTLILEPATPVLDLLRPLRIRIYAHQGSDAAYARHQRRLLLEAGFAYAECYPTAHPASGGTPDSVRAYARAMRDHLLVNADGIVAAGMADAVTVEALDTELLAWSERADATVALLFFCSIGWVNAPDISDGRQGDSRRDIHG